MAGAVGTDRSVDSWGWRGARRQHRLWRVWWNKRPGMVAEVTGPSGALDALIKVSDDRVMERLPWVPLVLKDRL